MDLEVSPSAVNRQELRINRPPEHSLASRSPRAKKSLGQHFLVDTRIRRRMMGAAELSADDFVVEIGPGRGFLTGSLAGVVGGLVVVELDDALAQRLTMAFAGRSNVEVVCADARESDIDSLVAQHPSYKVVANLPYYAASPIVRRFLEAERKPTVMVVMLQREVARQMAAAPGEMSLLSVATQLYGKPRIVTQVPPRAFRPPPKVKSAVVRIDVFPKPALELGSAKGFFRLVRGGFSAPRKQLRNSLSQGLTLPPVEAQGLLARASIDPTRRPQTLSMAEWGRLYEVSRLRTESVEA